MTLRRDLAAAVAAQQSGKPSLHLVVLGHVDAGKSTLMGRLLHDLGFVSQKEAHKNAKEAAQMGKVSGPTRVVHAAVPRFAHMLDLVFF